MKNVYGDHVLVTGASSGIGLACARAFAANGCTVTGISRHCEEKTVRHKSGGSIRFVRGDVTDEARMKEIVAEMNGVHICVLAAGMGVAGPAEELPMDLAREQMETNYFGALTAGRAVLPVMRKQGKGLFAAVSSIAGRVSIPMQCHYSSSKYALEAYIDAVRMEMRPYGVRACLIEPGDTKTGFTSARKTALDPESPYAPVLEASVAKMAHDEQHGRSPEDAAKALLRLAGTDSPRARTPIGIEYRLLMGILPFMPDSLKEKILSALYLPRV